MIRFYVLPIVTVDYARGPKYLAWRFEPEGIPAHWSLKDFGFQPAGIVCADVTQAQHDELTGHDDVLAAPADLDAAIATDAARDRVRDALEDLQIPGAWVQTAMPYREVLRPVTHLCMFAQRYHGLTGRKIVEPGYTLSTLIADLPADVRVNLASAAISLGYDTSPVLPTMTYRTGLKILADQWGDVPVLWGLAMLAPRRGLRRRLRRARPRLARALPATDDFTGTNGAELADRSGWAAVGAFSQDIQSNAIVPDHPNNEQCCRWTSDSFDDDQYSQATIYSGSTHLMPNGVAARCSASATTYYGYYGNVGAKTRYLFKVVEESFTGLSSSDQATQWADADTICLECEGTTLTPLVNDAEDVNVGAQTDSAISSGSAGLTAYGNEDAGDPIDDWEGGDLGGAPPATISSDLLLLGVG